MMKLHKIKGVHSKGINSVLVNRNTGRTLASSTPTLRAKERQTEKPNHSSAYPPNRQFKRSWESSPKITDLKPISRKKRSIFVNLNSSLNFSLVETVSAPPRIIDYKPIFLEQNYQSEDLKFEREEKEPKILVVENQDESRDLICSILRGEKYQVIEAKDSNIAIEKAQNKLPDLIICELMMPIIDGYGIAHLLRQSKITSEIPLLFITVNPREDNIGLRIILITDQDTIEPFTKEKLLTAITHKINHVIATR